MKSMKLTALALACALMAPMGAMAAGAIAVDDNVGEKDPGYGYSLNKDSRDEAGRSALRQCKEYGNDDCRVVVRFDTCGAYAASRKVFGIGWGTTKKAAVRMAMDQCERDSCKVIVAECEDD